MKTLLKKIIPAPIIKDYHLIQSNYMFWKVVHYNRVNKIRKKQKANVVFFISTLSMWRYQDIYDILSKDKRFNVYIIFYPFSAYSEEQKEENYKEIVTFFEKKEVTFLDLFHSSNVGDTMLSINPDVLFYPQQYEGCYKNELAYSFYKDRLLCHIPYALNIREHPMNYQGDFFNIAYRIYRANQFHKTASIRFSDERGRNVKIVGEPHADEFGRCNTLDPWNGTKSKKRIIYAPHFQITPNPLFYRPSFLWTYDIMLKLAIKYSDIIQFAFKPHPRLFSELCNYPGWGKEKTQEYFKKWEDLPNAQFENGEFVELFKTSDALIHDSGSFTGEYQYTKKPCMFLTKDIDSVISEHDEFGQKCVLNHYIGSTEGDIVNFIENVVLKGDDPKKKQREQFYKDYLVPPDGKTTAENIYNDLVTSLFGK